MVLVGIVEQRCLPFVLLHVGCHDAVVDYHIGWDYVLLDEWDEHGQAQRWFFSWIILKFSRGCL